MLDKAFEFMNSGWLETGNSKLENLDLPM